MISSNNYQTSRRRLFIAVVTFISRYVYSPTDRLTDRQTETDRYTDIGRTNGRAGRRTDRNTHAKTRTDAHALTHTHKTCLI